MPNHDPDYLVRDAYPDAPPTNVRLAAVPRATVLRPVTRGGMGVHTGVAAEVRITAAPFGYGLGFVTGRGLVRAVARNARAGDGRLSLEHGKVRVDTVEHLLAACAGLGFTDLRICVDGPEVPILDGSAQGWVDALDEAGRHEGPLRSRRVLPAVTVEGVGGGRAWCRPGPDRLEVHVDFGPGGPRGHLGVPRTPEGFRRIAGARTFVLAHQIASLRAAGRGRGATAANTLVWPTAPPTDEPVRHKALDAWGDLAVLGPVSGTIVVERGSHALHQRLVQAIERSWS